MELVLSNSGYALLALAGLTIVLHFFLVYPKNLSKKQWKKVDYIWISLTAVGLISATNNVKSTLAQNELNYSPGRIASNYNYLMSFLSPEGSSVVCNEFIRSEFSPPDFDSIVADQKRSCEWSKAVYRLVASMDTSDFVLIDKSKIPYLEKGDKWLKELITDCINKYNIEVSRKLELESDISSSSGEGLLFFSPFLLIIGLAIRITKVSGELRHESISAAAAPVALTPSSAASSSDEPPQKPA